MNKPSKLNYFSTLLIIALLLVQVISSALFAQNEQVITRYRGLFKEVYGVNVKDTSLRQGMSKVYYKDKVIEKGRYAENERVGAWQYYSLNSIFEYEYNYDSKEIVAINGTDYEDLKMKTPCLFVGSPLIPYLFMVTNLGYPEKAKHENIEGKVVLALRIDRKGEVYGIYLAEKLHPVIDHAVMNVAKKIPIDWQFLSATYMGESIPSEYHIIIEFELE